MIVDGRKTAIKMKILFTKIFFNPSIQFWFLCYSTFPPFSSFLWFPCFLFSSVRCVLFVLNQFVGRNINAFFRVWDVLLLSCLIFTIIFVRYFIKRCFFVKVFIFHITSSSAHTIILWQYLRVGHVRQSSMYHIMGWKQVGGCISSVYIMSYTGDAMSNNFIIVFDVISFYWEYF